MPQIKHNNHCCIDTDTVDDSPTESALNNGSPARNSTNDKVAFKPRKSKSITNTNSTDDYNQKKIPSVLSHINGCAHNRICQFRLTRTLALRVLFVLSLFVTGLVCTTLAYTIISDLELEVGRQTYESVANSALSAAQAITQRKIQGGNAMESILASAFPNATQWPTVGLNNFGETANIIAGLAGEASIVLAVLVRPDQVDEFEVHARKHYRDQGYLETAGSNAEVGFGIRYRHPDGYFVLDRTGNYTTYETDNRQIMTPILDHSTWDSPMRMYNIHVSSTAVDSIIECTEHHNLHHQLTTTKNNGTEVTEPLGRSPSSDLSNHPNCSIVSGFKVNDEEDLIGLIYKPIYPRNDPSTLVGMIGLSVNFKDVLVSVVPDYFDGITAVISTHKPKQAETAEDSDNTEYNRAYDEVTYNIVSARPQLVGEGDLHNRKYDDYARSIVLNDFSTDAPDAVIYTLTLYPNDFRQFHTKSPLAISMAFVGAIVFSTLLFFLYDYLMRRQSNEQKIVLQMKRQFVRFISHEIRTPLNTVCMGLELLEGEIQTHEDFTETKNTVSSSSATSGEDTTIKCPSTVNKHDLETWHEITSDIRDNATNAVCILDDLLNYDKIESGDLVLEIGKVCICDVVMKAERKFRVQAANRQVNLRIQNLEFCSEMKDALDNVVVMGDDMRLGQVICNLLSNALKFTPAGGSVVVSMEHIQPGETVMTSINDRQRGRDRESRLSTNSCLCDSPRAGSIMISVKDTGAGMTPEQISRLFTEGVQFDANKLQAGGGSGLGLCISKGIVERHNGRIFAMSGGLGKGSTFTVQLPLYQLVAESNAEQSRNFQTLSSMDQTEKNPNNSIGTTNTTDEIHKGNDAPARVTNNVAVVESVAGQIKQDWSTPCEKKSHHILVVEDVASSRKMLIRLLQREGHTCVAACDGQEAVDAVMAVTSQNQQSPGNADLEKGTWKEFDTILMDYEMPILNGPDATKKLREIGFNHLIIGVTGNVLSDDVDYFLAKGANRVLPKPVSIALLNDAWENPTSSRGGSKRNQNNRKNPPDIRHKQLDQHEIY